MPKQIDYPRATLKNSLQLAKAVDDLGGECSVELAADKLNKKVSGAFHALMGATSKYGLIHSKGGRLTVTQLYRDYKLAYSNEEANRHLTRAFLSPALFAGIESKFSGKKLPVSIFEKMLIKEFAVPENVASRVSKYFLEGAKQCGILGTDNLLKLTDKDDSGDAEDTTDEEQNSPDADTNVEDSQKNLPHSERTSEDGYYSVRVTGPDLDSVVVVKNKSHLLIVNAMLETVKESMEETAKSEE